MGTHVDRELAHGPMCFATGPLPAKFMSATIPPYDVLIYQKESKKQCTAFISTWFLSITQLQDSVEFKNPV